MTPWTRSDPIWQGLTPWQRAAAMGLLEADGADPVAARNAVAAMINRSMAERVPLGDHVGLPIYQPAIEPAQQRRLAAVLASPHFADLARWAERRTAGVEDDPVGGATHFLVHPDVMLRLSGGVQWTPQGWRGVNPKYRSWPQWTGYDPATGQYRGAVTRDASHVFLAPGGAQSAPSPRMRGPDEDAEIALSPAASETVYPGQVGAGVTAPPPIATPPQMLAALARMDRPDPISRALAEDMTPRSTPLAMPHGRAYKLPGPQGPTMTVASMSKPFWRPT
jgi:hypothetical protein